MEKRRSINVPGASHVNPIPSASRKGPFVVYGRDFRRRPGDRQGAGRSRRSNAARCSTTCAASSTAAGGTPDDIVKMTVWITDRALRPILNKYWVEMFPDPQSRPARHTVASGDFTPPMQIQCDLLAVIGD